MSEEKLFRIFIPKYPYPNVFSFVAMPPLGPFFVGASVRKKLGWNVEIIDENNFKGELDHEKLQAERPADFVGFYIGLTSIAPRAYKLAKIYRALGIKTIAGGGHVDALPEEALREGLNVVVLGEGEESVPEVLEALSSRKSLEHVEGIAFCDEGNVIITKRRPPIKELSKFPHPDFSMLTNPAKKINYAPICHSRGCIYRCEFCSVSLMLGPPRVAPPEHTLENFTNLLEQGYRGFFYVDDNFACSRENTIQLCQGMAEIEAKHRVKPSIAVQVRLDVADDDELLMAMKNAGVKVMCLGLESPIEEDLQKMRKGYSASGMRERIAKLKSMGFILHGMFIFGYPQEDSKLTVEPSAYAKQARVFWDFIRKSKIDTIQVLKAVPIPGTRLFKRLKEAGRILPNKLVNWDKYDGNFLTYLPDKGCLMELHEAVMGIMKKFYSAASAYKFALTLIFAPFIVMVRAGYEYLRCFINDLAVAINNPQEGLKRLRPRRLMETFTDSWAKAVDAFYKMLRNYRLRWIGNIILRKWIREVRKTKALAILKKIDSQINRTINLHGN